MDVPEELLCLFSATIDERDGSYTITIPEREVETGDVARDEAYRVAVLGPATTAPDERADDDPVAGESRADSESPVEVGDHRTVEIEGIGEQGDGIARVDRGYVIIVPDTEKRERVTVEITDVAENVAFGTVVERKPYYE